MEPGTNDNENGRRSPNVNSGDLASYMESWTYVGGSETMDSGHVPVIIDRNRPDWTGQPVTSPRPLRIPNRRTRARHEPYERRTQDIGTQTDSSRTSIPPVANYSSRVVIPSGEHSVSFQRSQSYDVTTTQHTQSQLSPDRRERGVRRLSSVNIDNRVSPQQNSVEPAGDDVKKCIEALERKVATLTERVQKLEEENNVKSG